MPSLLTVFLSTPFHKLPSVKPYSILMTLRRTVLNDGDESSFDLSRPSSPWLCRNDGPTRECLDSDEQKNQFIILSLDWIWRIGQSPSSIYSCSIGHILEHEFCNLGCWAVKEKFLKRRNFCLSMLLFGVFFSCFWGQKNSFLIFFLHCSVLTKKLL